MREFIEAFYRYRNDPRFELCDNIRRREMGFVVGNRHWFIPLNALMRFETHIDPDGMPEIEARLREEYLDFYNDWFEARRRYAVNFLRENDVIKTNSSLSSLGSLIMI